MSGARSTTWSLAEGRSGRCWKGGRRHVDGVSDGDVNEWRNVYRSVLTVIASVTFPQKIETEHNYCHIGNSTVT